MSTPTLTRRLALALPFAARQLFAALPTAVPATLRVQVRGKTVVMALEQYVAAAVAGEGSSFQSQEALKAMAVAARTYAVRFSLQPNSRHHSEGFDVCDTTHCQRMDLKAVTPRLTAAAQQTASQLIWYRGQPALAYYTGDCGGQSEDAGLIWAESGVPYLKSHSDPYCKRHGGQHWHWETSGAELSTALQQSGLRTPTQTDRITITRRAPSGRALQLAMTGGEESVSISGSTLRFAIGRALGFNTVRSDKYNVGVAGNRLIFDGMGSGHGVGLCQQGADQMGLEKHSYREILAFYYAGTAVGVTAAEAASGKANPVPAPVQIPEGAWRRLSSERITLYTTQPEQDGMLLANGDRQLVAAARRVNLPVPPRIELRVYPTVAAFRDATGEPGWVAARTSGYQLQLQPLNILQSRGVLAGTLYHEFLHAILNQDARSELPVWFREGLVEYLSDTSVVGQATSHIDADLRQREEAERARAAYASARQRVAKLVRDYDETTVLGWVTRGLPREVTNATANPPATKSK